ncbi:MAG: excinuclease ABC subunit UvrA, partial [Bacteroidetes bacterium]|nr:excinuclease ABC subunit UvrA [Bacteroidota bacterium]
MIRIKGARHNNLKNIDIELPHNTFICVTGVSGSGKSSLVYDIIARESRRRFFETYSAHIRQYMQRLSRPDVDEISGLKPVLTINQHTAVSNPRSTLGTYTGIYDLFRLLYARCGEKTGDQNVPLSRSLFSFHAPPGACPACEGIGTEYYIDPEMLIEDANKSLREGCMSITTPNGYIMYSQVTLDVLNEVCVVNGFSIDIPWNQLTEADKHVVLYGSENIIIPFGKHTLESRMTWTGITAKPREEGFYKGIIPVMQVILNREKNPGILRFCKTITCRKCSGKRLSDAALSVSFKGKDIAELNALSLEAIHSLFTTHLSHKISEVDAAISNEILKKTSAIMSLGLGYLSPSRLTSSLSGGEVQRLRLANLADSKITNVLFVLDEPGAGLHPDEVSSVIQIIENLVARGNSVIAVEHNLQIIGRASYIIELGPEAGDKGGEVVFSGPASEFFNHQNKITTRSWVCGEKFREIKPLQPPGDEKISIINADLQNLRKVSVEFCKRAINLVTGISGSGRKSLVGGVLCGSIQAEAPVGCDEIRGVENMQLVNISQNPIGKTPRSNAATYTKVFDEIRDLFARQPVAKAKRFGKSRFSFNVKGGRCEKCEGAGVISVGMHFLGTMHSICPGCEGKRFNDETLTVQYRGNNISEVLEMKVEEALGFFTHENKITAVLKVLKDIGLGYLSLGQPSTTLSGGEAQRIKLATELARKTAGEKLFVINHPTIGLHADDAVRLLEILKRLTELGHTVIAIEHHPVFLAGAAHIVELGMDSDNNSGYLIAQGPVSAFLKLSHSAIGRFLSKLNSDDASFVVKS